MNHRHRKVLHALFSHPISSNISLKDVEAVLVELGAEIDNKHGARIGVSLGGHSAAFHTTPHSLPKDDVVQIRHFLEKCGVDPAQYPV